MTDCLPGQRWRRHEHIIVATIVDMIVAIIFVTTTSSTTRLAVLSDLLTDLPAPEGREDIAIRPCTDRSTIAKSLIEGASV